MEKLDLRKGAWLEFFVGLIFFIFFIYFFGLGVLRFFEKIYNYQYTLPPYDTRGILLIVVLAGVASFFMVREYRKIMLAAAMETAKKLGWIEVDWENFYNNSSLTNFNQLLNIFKDKKIDIFVVYPFTDEIKIYVKETDSAKVELVSAQYKYGGLSDAIIP